MLLAVVVTVLAAAVIVAVTWLAAVGRLRVNTLAGYRFRYFLAGDDAWQAGHRAALLPTVVGAAALAAGGLAALGAEGEGAQAVCIIGGCVILLACVGWGVVRGNRAALDAVAAREGGAGGSGGPSG
jgi:uncharacterized membrane protein